MAFRFISNVITFRNNSNEEIQIFSGFIIVRKSYENDDFLFIIAIIVLIKCFLVEQIINAIIAICAIKTADILNQFFME